MPGIFFTCRIIMPGLPPQMLVVFAIMPPGVMAGSLSRTTGLVNPHGADPAVSPTGPPSATAFYSGGRDGRLSRGEVQHARWPLQEATVDIRINTLAGIPLGPMHPTVLFSRQIDVVLWSLERVD